MPLAQPSSLAPGGYRTVGGAGPLPGLAPWTLRLRRLAYADASDVASAGYQAVILPVANSIVWPPLSRRASHLNSSANLMSQSKLRRRIWSGSPAHGSTSSLMPLAARGHGSIWGVERP